MESCVHAMPILTTPWRARALLCMILTAAVVPHAAAQRVSVTTLAGSVTTLAGSGEGNLDGIGTAARFSCPYGMDVSSDGKSLYVGDWSNFCVRKINIETAEVATLAGSGSKGLVDGRGTAASFSYMAV